MKEEERGVGVKGQMVVTKRNDAREEDGVTGPMERREHAHVGERGDEEKAPGGGETMDEIAEAEISEMTEAVAEEVVGGEEGKEEEEINVI